VPFGSPAGGAEIAAAVTFVTGLSVDVVRPDLVIVALGHDEPRLAPLAFAHGWRMDPAAVDGNRILLRPCGP